MRRRSRVRASEETRRKNSSAVRERFAPQRFAAFMKADGWRMQQFRRGGAPPGRLARRRASHAPGVLAARVGGRNPGGDAALARAMRYEIAALERLSGARCVAARANRTVAEALRARTQKEGRPR